MIFGEIKRLEVVIIELDLGPFGHQKAKPGKNIAYLFNDQGDGMLGPLWRASAGEGHIDYFQTDSF